MTGRVGQPRAARFLDTVRSTRFVLVVLVILASSSSLVWSMAIPENYGGDEKAYQEVVQFLADNKRFPEFGVDDEGVEAVTIDRRLPPYPYRSYADRPGLPFILAAGSMLIPPNDPPADGLQVRLPGMLYAALFVLIAFAATRALLPTRGDLLAISVASAAATWPQVSSTFAVLNDDGLMVVSTSGLVWAWARGARDEWSYRSCMLLGGFAALTLLAKPSGYVILGATLLIAACTLRGSWLGIVRRLAVVLATTIVLAGWRFAIAVWMYGLDIFNSSKTQELMSSLDATTHPASDYMSFWALLSGYSTTAAYANSGPFFSTLATTFLGNFTYQGIRLGGMATTLVACFAVVAAYQVIAAAFETRAGVLRRWIATPVARVQIIVFALIPVIVCAVFWRTYTVDMIIVGQYAFPVLLPVLMVISSGLYLAAEHRRRALLGAYGLVLLGCNVWSVRVLVTTLGRGPSYERSQFTTVFWYVWMALVVVAALTLIVWWSRGRSGTVERHTDQ